MVSWMARDELGGKVGGEFDGELASPPTHHPALANCDCHAFFFFFSLFFKYMVEKYFLIFFKVIKIFRNTKKVAKSE